VRYAKFGVSGVLFASAQVALAQAVPQPTKAASEIYAEHLQCSIDISFARGFIRSTRPEMLPKVEEALGAYFNRTLGVAATVGLTAQQVTAEMLSGVRAVYAQIASEPDEKKSVADSTLRLDRAKACLRSIGYSIN